MPSDVDSGRMRKKKGKGGERREVEELSKDALLQAKRVSKLRQLVRKAQYRKTTHTYKRK